MDYIQRFFRLCFEGTDIDEMESVVEQEEQIQEQIQEPEKEVEQEEPVEESETESKYSFVGNHACDFNGKLPWEIVSVTLPRHSTGKLVTVNVKASRCLKFRFTEEPTSQVVTIIGVPTYITSPKCFRDKCEASKLASSGSYDIDKFDYNVDTKFHYFPFHYEHHIQYIRRCSHGCFHIRSVKMDRRWECGYLNTCLKEMDSSFTPPGYLFIAPAGIVSSWISNKSLDYFTRRLTFGPLPTKKSSPPTL